MEELEQRQRREENRKLLQFRSDSQKYEARREYDLNEPHSLLHEDPIRAGDEDSRLGVSSSQILFGEDLEAKERSRMQKEQLRYWVAQQAMEKEERKRAEQEAQR